MVRKNSIVDPAICWDPSPQMAWCAVHHVHKHAMKQPDLTLMHMNPMHQSYVILSGLCLACRDLHDLAASQQWATVGHELVQTKMTILSMEIIIWKSMFLSSRFHWIMCGQIMTICFSLRPIFRVNMSKPKQDLQNNHTIFSGNSGLQWESHLHFWLA